MPIQQLGPYRIGRQLGRGGMGTVYEGTNDETGEPAAVKILSLHLAEEEGFRSRFEAEIETLKKLRHPNIVRLYGWGEHDGCVFYAMELVVGRSLEEELKAGRRFEWQEVTQIGVKMCRALKHAHDHGVIHRDIKPANIMLASDGEVKLSDFGIAKLFGSTGMTATGGVLGTAEYMAPEQADGRPVTYRCDLYSLGGVLYTLLARRPPFVSRNIVEMLNLQRSAIPDPVRRYAHETPEELEAIIAQLLEKDPDKRIRSAMLLGRRLEAMEHGLLSRAAREQEANQAASAGYGLSPSPGGSDDLPGLDPLGVTRAATGAMAPPTPASVVKQSQLNETMATGEVAPAGEVVQGTNPKLTGSTTNRFTTVEEERQRAPVHAEEEVSPLVSPQAWGLVAALLLLGAGGWWLLQPPNADRLYERIAARAGEDKIESLLEAEDDIVTFLRYYPSDTRFRELQDYQEDLKLYREERQLDRQARRRSSDEILSPVQRTYIEAIQSAESDPERALAKLQALIGLYDDEQNMPESTRRCVELARRKLVQLRREVDAHKQDHLNLLEQRLDRADELRASDPAAARAVWRGVIELYGEKPWAEEPVKRARDALNEAAENRP